MAQIDEITIFKTSNNYKCYFALAILTGKPSFLVRKKCPLPQTGQSHTNIFNYIVTTIYNCISMKDMIEMCSGQSTVLSK